jgi:Zn-finger nucleic acid-binding protein
MPAERIAIWINVESNSGWKPTFSPDLGRSRKMRTLVACPKCNRQYDAEGLSVGRKFHCHCGTVLEVQQAKGLDASVVCCSHCGAPRIKGALSCEHCDADFTLHERDLDTVCPHCAARVSDKARFCHHCGKRISPELFAGVKTEFNCPVCEGRKLVSRAWGDISILECTRCAGMWLGHDAFHHSLKQAEAHQQQAGWLGAGVARQGEVDTEPPDGGRRYRPCAVCRQLMPKKQFGSSGVVIDHCKDHGVWFDADELSRILGWVHSGGHSEARKRQAAESAEVEKEKRIAKAMAARGERGIARSPWTDADGSDSFFEDAIRWIFRL